MTAKNTGRTVKGKSWKVRFLIVVISILYTLSYVSVFILPDFFFPIHSIDNIYFKIAGTGIITIALILGISTLITMKNSWRMGITEDQDTELILNGFFRFSRNPYFLSYLMVFTGVFLMFPTILFLVFLLAMAIVIHLMILDEEKYLTGQHGQTYVEYVKSVNRYISLGIKSKKVTRNS